MCSDSLRNTQLLPSTNVNPSSVSCLSVPSDRFAGVVLPPPTKISTTISTIDLKLSTIFMISYDDVVQK